MSTPSTLTAWERWELASFDEVAQVAELPGHVDSGVPPEPSFAETELARVKEEAYRAGFDEGRSAGHDEGRKNGLAAGHAEGKAAADALGKTEVAALVRLAETFDQQLAELDGAVATDLMALSIEIARKVIVQTLAIRPEAVIAAIHEALTHLPVQHATIHLHPEDASLARTYAGEQLSHSGHRIHEDPRLKRGDVVIDAGGSHVDATVATRWRRVLDELGQDEPWIIEPEK